MALNDKFIQSLKAKEKSYKVYDEKGLFLYVSKTGSKSWRVKYMTHGKCKEITLGQYPILSLAEARQMRNDVLKQRLEGIDPAENKQVRKKEQQKKELENVMTFEKVAKDWIRANVTKWEKNTQKNNIGRLNLHILPVLGNIPIININFEQLKNIPLKLENNGKFDTAQRVAIIINQICMYAKLNQWTQYNIADGLTMVLGGKPKNIKSGLPAITEPQQVGLMLRLINEYISLKRLTTPIGGALKLAPLLALRPTELVSSQWKELDFENKILKIPSNRMKMRKSHDVPLSRQALAIFQDLFNRRVDNGYIFRSGQKEGHITPESVNKAMHGAGIAKGEMVLHSWRKVFSTLCNEALVPSILIEKCLAHSIGNEVEQAYNKAQYLDSRRVLMQWWADYLDALREEKELPKFNLEKP